MSSTTSITALKKKANKEYMTFYLLISPWLVGLLLFTIGPMVSSIVISFLQWDLVSPARFVGFKNYTDMFAHDEIFWQSIKVTLIYVAVRVPLSLIAALMLAVLMNQKVPGIGFFRTVFYLPTVVSGVAVSMLWVWTFNTDFGLVNGVLEKIGIQGPGWFSDPHWSLATIILTSLYGVGGTALIFLAGLKNIPVSLYEAAELDGATTWKKFLYITIPQLTPTILFNLIMNIIGSFQTFTEALIITNGGPVNSTLFYNLYLYQNAFTYSKLGYACSLAWVLFVITLCCSYYTFRSTSKWVYYEGGER
jgi:multiple sugar transport system permease protein